MISKNDSTAIRAAVKQFWVSRTGAGAKQLATDQADRGERANVTSGKHLDGFADFITRLGREFFSVRI